MKKLRVCTILSLFFLSALLSTTNFSINFEKTTKIPYENDNYTPKMSDDTYEPNDDFSNAKFLNPNYYPGLNASDQDWYYFWAENGDYINVSLYFDSGFGDLSLELYNDTNFMLNSSQLIGPDYRLVTYEAQYSGYYYIRIENISTSNFYDLDIWVSKTNDDQFEENDDFSTAPEIFPNYYPGLNASDDDWYKLWVNEGDIMNISIYFDNGLGNLELELFNNTQTMLNYSYTPNNYERTTYNANYTGYYYIHVFNVSYPNIYDMDIWIYSSSFLDITTPNATTQWYKGNSNDILWDSSGDFNNVTIELWNSSGYIQPIATETVNDGYYNWPVPNYLQNGKDYRIELYNPSGPQYSVSDDFEIIGDDRFEPNDVFSNAYTLDPGFYGNLACANSDYYRVYCNSGEKLTIDLYFNNNDGNIDLELWEDTDTTQLNSSYSSTGNEQVSYTATYTGYYYIWAFYQDYQNYYYSMDISVEVSDYLEVTQPTVSSIWEMGKNYEITWSSSGFSYIDIELYQGGAYLRDIMMGTSDSGGYWWTVPTDLQPGTDYQVRIDNDDAVGIWDFSEYFEIREKPIGDVKTIFYDDFESGTGKWSGWSADNYWHLTSTDYFSASHSLWCGNETTGDYSKKDEFGSEISYEDIIQINNLNFQNFSKAQLAFNYKMDTYAGGGYDIFSIKANIDGNQLYFRDSLVSKLFTVKQFETDTSFWPYMIVDLSFFCGYDDVDLLFSFKADSWSNNYGGVFIDNVNITGEWDETTRQEGFCIEVDDEYIYEINYLESDYFQNIFGKDPFGYIGDKFKLKVTSIGEGSAQWMITARFWMPGTNFDEMGDATEYNYYTYKNPLNSKGGTDFFQPCADFSYLQQADNVDKDPWVGDGYRFNTFTDIWNDDYWGETYIYTMAFDDFKVERHYNSKGLLLGMSFLENQYADDTHTFFEFWLLKEDEYEEEEPDDEEDVYINIPGFDISLLVTLIGITSLIYGLKVIKHKRKEFSRT